MALDFIQKDASKNSMMKKIITLLFVLISLQSFSQSTTLVISQVYGGGGNASAPFNADFLELHNISATAQSTAGLSVQYASSGATGTWTGVFALPTASIPAGGYYLIRLSATGATGAALPTPDAAPAVGSEIAMSATNGRVALVTGTTALSGCPTTNVIDLVGFGSSVCWETAATPVLSNTTAALRNNNGCTDTNNNLADFTVGTPAPRNSASAIVTCGAASSTLSATALTGFGNVCINTTVGPNSFTITGTMLTTANVTVAALAGFTFSTTSGGTYTASLNLTQPGGAYSQEIFVRFTPTAVQSYNGNIVVGGGGASSINVAAAGSGINAPVLTTGGAISITQVSATLEGTITNTGCTAVTAYGIEYSTTAGFPNGTGTPVASTNLSGGVFTSNLSGLTLSTTYYYHAYATNGGGTGYGAEQSFTTSSPPASSSVVISQVYGGGGNSGATYINDFIELFNRGTAAVSLNGWSVQYNSASSTTAPWQVTDLTNVMLQPGQYYLIQQAAGTGGTVPLPTPDAIGIIAMSGTNGKVALMNNNTVLAIQCPSAGVMDLVGYGSSNCFEGSGATAVLSNTTVAIRLLNGCTDTNDNTPDFTTGTPNPRNSASTFNICGAAAPTLSATALTAFGNVCVNTTAGPNSFTITGTALTTANVTVGALAGFTYSTTAGGTYTTTLSLTQPGGAYSQQIFVRLTPTAVQSYNGNIPVGGGGATAIDVAAAGAGINIVVTTGASSIITGTTATLAGTATTTCAAITAYGTEYSTTNNFPNGTGTQVPSTNINGSGNYTSALSGLIPATTYYYKAYATNAGGTHYGSQMSFVTAAAPVLSASALTGFGNVCINTTAGPNPFTITGTNLTAANVTVGPLTGFTYSTTAGGTYTASLSLTQPGGAFSQQVFVQFMPTLVQSYNGNIAVGGGGAVSINVAATGAGVNSVPTVTSGAASAITTVSATVAGTIPGNGCSAVTAYGVEYSLINGFPNGSGTAVPSTNLSGISFSSGLTGLTPNTTYYYHAYATNIGGTGYGNQQSFLTLSLTPTLTATTLASFGNVCINTTAGPNSFTINGSALNATNISVGPLGGFAFSTTSGGTYTASLSLTQPGGTFSQPIFVQFTPTLVQSYNGNIPVSGGGAAAINVAAVGSGINTTATVTTAASSAVTSISATAAGTIPTIGCSPVTVYGIEYSTVNGFPDGTGTQVPSTNLTGINFSSNLTGLAPTTTYYYKAYATNNGGTVWGTQMSFTTATPGLSTSALTGFGNICLNVVAGPNSFTITGTNLTTANVTIAVLAGFTYSTTSGGTYTVSLSLTQPGGTYSQTIFVRFTPTAVQSYNGNIVTGGGGAASVNRAVTGAGINTAPSVNNGAASAITQTSATVAGTIPSTGCSAITAYGIEFSTTNGFPNGTGTAVASTNLSGINFSSALTGLSPATVYYFHTYATNAGGTAYGVQGTFTTAVPVLTATPLTAFGANCLNTTAGPNSFVINSTAVTAANINVGPLAGYTFSTTSGGTYTASLSLLHPAGPFTQTVFVKFTPIAVQSYNGSIPVAGGGAATINVGASGSGTNTVATVVTGSATIHNPNSVTLNGNVSNTGCSPVTVYGIEYSSISGLANGLGTKLPSSNLNAGNFSSTVNGLVQGAKYYYKAYATNNGGTTYGAEQSFTMSSIPGGFVIYNNPVQRNVSMHYTYRDLKPGHYQIQIFNSNGQLVYQRALITQWNFIDDNFMVPGNLAPGTYSLHIVNPDFRDKKVFMIR